MNDTPVRCHSCGLMNMSSAEECRRCGAGMRMTSGTIYSPRPIAEPQRPSFDKKAFVVALIALAAAIGLPLYLVSYDSDATSRSERCSATARATLDDEYVVTTTYIYLRKIPLPVSVDKHFKVGYSYTANGQRYHESAVVTTEPKDPEVAVYFDPKDPHTSEIERYQTSTWLRLGQLAGAPLLLFGLFKMRRAFRPADPNDRGNLKLPTISRPVRLVFATLLACFGLYLCFVAYRNLDPTVDGMDPVRYAMRRSGEDIRRERERGVTAAGAAMADSAPFVEKASIAMTAGVGALLVFLMAWRTSRQPGA